jgi:GAF domain-containing protein
MSIVHQLNELTNEVNDFITNASNFSAFIFEQFNEINWVGFYMLSGQNLILGPFQGKPACIKISLGKGVCGTAAEKQESIIVDDVHKFEGHIACDSNSNSEIVIPIIVGGKLMGVLDIDSPKFNRFSDTDKVLLQELLDTLLSNSNMEKIYAYYNN